MSIATAIQNAQGKVANAYTAVSGKGGTLPATQDLSNLPTAINSIQVSSGSLVASQAERMTASTNAYYNMLCAGTSFGSVLNLSNSVTVTSGTYSLWYGSRSTSGYHYVIATINL